MQSLTGTSFPQPSETPVQGVVNRLAQAKQEGVKKISSSLETAEATIENIQNAYSVGLDEFVKACIEYDLLNQVYRHDFDDSFLAQLEGWAKWQQSPEMFKAQVTYEVVYPYGNPSYYFTLWRQEALRYDYVKEQIRPLKPNAHRQTLIRRWRQVLHEKKKDQVSRNIVYWSTSTSEGGFTDDEGESNNILPRTSVVTGKRVLLTGCPNTATQRYRPYRWRNEFGLDSSDPGDEMHHGELKDDERKQEMESVVLQEDDTADDKMDLEGELQHDVTAMRGVCLSGSEGSSVRMDRDDDLEDECVHGSETAPQESVNMDIRSRTARTPEVTVDSMAEGHGPSSSDKAKRGFMHNALQQVASRVTAQTITWAIPDTVDQVQYRPSTLATENGTDIRSRKTAQDYDDMQTLVTRRKHGADGYTPGKFWFCRICWHHKGIMYKSSLRRHYRQKHGLDEDLGNYSPMSRDEYEATQI